MSRLLYLSVCVCSFCLSVCVFVCRVSVCICAYLWIDVSVLKYACKCKDESYLNGHLVLGLHHELKPRRSIEVTSLLGILVHRFEDVDTKAYRTGRSGRGVLGLPLYGRRLILVHTIAFERQYSVHRPNHRRKLHALEDGEGVLPTLELRRVLARRDDLVQLHYRRLRAGRCEEDALGDDVVQKTEAHAHAHVPVSVQAGKRERGGLVGIGQAL